MGGGSQQTQTSKTEPWSVQQPYLEKGFSEAGQIYDQGPSEYFPGQTYTDMSPFRQAGLQGTANIAQSGNPLVNNASNYAANTLGGQGDNPYSDILNSGVQGMQATAGGQFLNNNPFLDDVYNSAADKAVDEWSTTIMPGIAAQFGNSGGAGTTMHSELAGRAGGELSDSLAQLKSSIYGGNYQQERDRQTQAQSGLSNLGANLYGTGVNERLNLTSQAPGLREAQYGDASKLQDVGKSFEEQQGKVLEDQINRYNYEQGAPLAALQDYMAMITGNYGSTSTSRTSSSGDPLSTVIGAGLTAASMFSDARLKNIIAHVATAPNGLKLYTFTYKDDPESVVHVGLIAQEVTHICPEAVHVDNSGYLKVNYAAALGSV